MPSDLTHQAPAENPDRPPSTGRVVAEAPMAALKRRERLRRAVNLGNLSTPLGLLIAKVGGATTSPGPRGVVLATGYRLGFPKASAFTVGNVVLTKLTLERLLARPALLCHETRHCTQYACCLGPLMLPAYGVAALWSLLRSGDPASRNVFERRAGLDDGGYVERPIRRLSRGRTPRLPRPGAV